ncbi:MAG: S41 family peptidase, partial [Myxococcota bacterium]
VLALGLLGASAPGLASESQSLVCERISELTRTYLHKHISFHYVNDKLRQRVIDNYVKRLDPSRSLYLTEEITPLKQQVRKGLQQVWEGNCSTLLAIQEDQVKRYKSMEKYAREVLADEGYELDPDAVLIIDPDKRAHPRTDELRKELVRRLIHFQMSNYLSSDMDFAEAKEKLTHRYELMTKRAQERTPEDIYAAYLDAFATALDPHSNYLSSEVLEDFQISMGLSLEGIGVALSSRDGYSVVEKIIPGGAADGMKVLEPKDKIIAVGQDGEAPVDIIDMDLRDVVRLIRGKRGTKVDLTVLRQGETTERFNVTIVRDKINLEEQAAKLSFSEVEIGGEKAKIAVIDLPSFYGGKDFGERQSTDDVKKLLQQAKEEKAVGLVLDLSRNGGGLLETSVDIAGFFIAEGGVVAVRNTFSQVDVLRDSDSEIFWDGPMVVLTSRVSASASEIVAGALKDYQRAVIVGDDHTFGKGTVQSMVPLREGLGALKVTTALFFRPGGQSTQNGGVSADVVVPSGFATSEFGEAHQDYSLPNQTIAAFLQEGSPAGAESDSETKQLAWEPITAELIAELAQRSQKRLAENEDMIEIRERIIKIEQRNGVVHLAELMAEQKENKEKAEQKKEEEEAAQDVTNGEESPAGVSKDKNDADETEFSVQQEEAVQVLTDLIQLTQGTLIAEEMSTVRR